MSGPVRPPLTVEESDGSVVVRPANTIKFNEADFTVAKSGNEATISIDSTGAGAALPSTQVGFGDSSNLLTGSTKLTWNDTTNSELLTVTGSNSSNQVRIINTADTANSAPDIKFYHDRGAGNATNGDYLAHIYFTGRNSVDAETVYYQQYGRAKTVTDGAEDGQVFNELMLGGTLRDFFRMEAVSGSGYVVFNEDAQNIDFRIETSGNQNTLKVDGGNDNVGIGGVPDSGVERLEVIGDGSANPMVQLRSTETGASSSPHLTLYRNATGTNNDDSGLLEFAWDNGGDTKVVGAQIYSEIQSITGGSESNRLRFYNRMSGSLNEMMRFSNNGIEINAFEQDIDTKISSDGVDGLFTVNAGQDNIGIGTNAPDSDVERLHVKGTGTGTLVRFESTDAGASAAPTVELMRNSGSPAPGDVIGALNFIGKDDGGNDTTYAQISAYISDETGATEDGWLRFGASFAGTLQPNMLTIRGETPQVVINEGSGDVDFRVESNGNSQMFKVDGGLNLVSVGAVPTAGGATFQVPDNTISHYCNVNAIRSDAVGIMVMVNEDNQGQMWVHESASAHTLNLMENGVKGMHFQFMSTDGDITINPGGSDTLNGGTASLTRSTNYEIYDVFCYSNGKWALSNPA